MKGREWPRETRIGAVADYLIGIPLKQIEAKWNVDETVVTYWVRKSGCFKLRMKPRKNNLELVSKYTDGTIVPL